MSARRAAFVAFSVAFFGTLAGCWLAIDSDYTGGSPEAGTTSSSSSGDATVNDAASPTDAPAAVDAAEAGATGYAAAVRADGPSLYFRFDEDDDTKFTDEVGGRVLNTEDRDAVDTGEPGAVKGHSIKLAGTSGLVLVGSIDWSMGKVFSFEMFVRPTATDDDYRRILEKVTVAQGGPIDGSYFWVNPAKTAVAFERWNAKTAVDFVYWHVVPSATDFTHLVVTVDGATTLMYANGALVGTSPKKAAAAAADPNVPFRVAGSLQGWLDELAYYEKPLTAAQVEAHYNAAQHDRP